LTIFGYTIDGNNVLHDVYFYLSKIYKLIGNYRSKYKMVVFDAIKEEDESLLNENIILCKLEICDHWTGLLPQINNYLELF